MTSCMDEENRQGDKACLDGTVPVVDCAAPDETNMTCFLEGDNRGGDGHHNEWWDWTSKHQLQT